LLVAINLVCTVGFPPEDHISKGGLRYSIQENAMEAI
jgi:hypothetical protein